MASLYINNSENSGNSRKQLISDIYYLEFPSFKFTQFRKLNRSLKNVSYWLKGNVLVIWVIWLSWEALWKRYKHWINKLPHYKFSALSFVKVSKSIINYFVEFNLGKFNVDYWNSILLLLCSLLIIDNWLALRHKYAVYKNSRVPIFPWGNEYSVFKEQPLSSGNRPPSSGHFNWFSAATKPVPIMTTKAGVTDMLSGIIPEATSNIKDVSRLHWKILYTIVKKCQEEAEFFFDSWLCDAAIIRRGERAYDIF